MTFSKHVFFYGLAVLVLFLPFSIIFLTIGNKSFEVKHQFQMREFTARNLSLYTHVKDAASSHVFTDVTLKKRSVHFLKHYFQGKYTFVRNEYFGFSLPLADKDGALQTDVLAYVIRPLNTSFTQKELYLKLQLLLEMKNQTELKLILPIFDVSFDHINPIQATTFILNSEKNMSSIDSTAKEHRATKLSVDGPFYIYLVEAMTKNILGNAFITHLGALIPGSSPRTLSENQTKVEEKHTPTMITKKLQFLAQTKEIQNDQLRFIDHFSAHRSVKFLHHSFSGKYISVRNNYVAFTIDLVEETERNQTGLMAYIIQPFKTKDTKDELFIKAKEGFKNTTVTKLQMILPMFDTKLVWFNKTTEPTLFELHSPTTIESINLYTSETKHTINGPFFLYIVDKYENQHLVDTFIYQLGTFIPQENKIGKSYFEAIVDSSQNLFRKAFIDLLGFSPVGVSYIFPFVYSLFDDSSTIAKEIVSYMPLDNITTHDLSIHDYTKVLTKNQYNFGYYFYSPTFQVPGDESNVGKFIQDANVEHTNNFTNFEKLQLGLHGLPLDASDLMLDFNAHTLIHYFNLEGWYWSTPFTVIKSLNTVLRNTRYMTAVVKTKVINVGNSEDHIKYRMFQLHLQKTPSEYFLENDLNEKINQLSVYIIDTHRDLNLLVAHKKFNEFRRSLQNTSANWYRVALPIFRSFEYNTRLESFQFSAPINQDEGSFLNSRGKDLIKIALNQTIHVCVNENGLGTPKFQNKNTREPDFIDSIAISSDFYFIIFDETQETIIANFLVSKKDFIADSVNCL